MRKEYNLKKLKVKRRGMLPKLAESSIENTKIRITISLDKDLIDFFKKKAKKPGALPYQTQINQALRTLLPGSCEHSAFYSVVKEELLHDKDFVLSLKEELKKAG
jgi:uncharacterized protein (DUF4415 family)